LLSFPLLKYFDPGVHPFCKTRMFVAYIMPFRHWP
jgi:hypothetical protein